MNSYPSWDDASLAVESDSEWRARYRRLQSWYREKKLRAAPGPSGAQPAVGSMLAKSAVAAKPALNFFDERVAAYVKERAELVKAQEGTLELQRVKHNMLSSMPLCFNLFGFLRTCPRDAAVVLSSALELPIHVIDEIEVEWAPRADRDGRLGDRTAFDAFLRYRTADGKAGFVGIETKYTEPFSPKKYDCSAYRKLTRTPAFKSRDAADQLVGSATNQLWRNLLLALSVREKQGFELGHVAVLACDGDPKAAAAVKGVSAQLSSPETHLRSTTLERVVSAAAENAATAEWARWFNERYLDWKRAAPTPASRK